MSYQSFSAGSGDSDTLAKLRALKLPDLRNRSVLDVGCNEGFFCWYALGAGATRAVGIDKHAGVIAAAQQRVPTAKFIIQDFDEIDINERFDVVLCVSALHYSLDAKALIRKLLSLLSPDGTLILELGVSNSHLEGGWEKVDRGLDTRSYPTDAKVSEFLSGSAWRKIGPSVNQLGDPVPRWVYHAQLRKPFMLVVTGPSNSGKTSLVRSLFGMQDPRVFRLDQFFFDIAVGTRQVSTFMAGVLSESDLINGVHLATDKLFSEPVCISELIAAMLEGTEGEDHIFEAFLPSDRIVPFCDICQSLGQRPWIVQEPTIRQSFEPSDVSIIALQGVYKVIGTKVKGAIDGLSREWDGLHIGGWAASGDGSDYAADLGMLFNGDIFPLEVVERTKRLDVAEAGYCHPNVAVGFDAVLRLDKEGLSRLKHIPVAMINSTMLVTAFDRVGFGSIIGRAPI